MLRSYRFLSFLGFLACAGGMALALYLEHFEGFDPCPMCVFQRVAMIAAGLVFLVAALHGPTGLWGPRVYAFFQFLAAGTGAAIAGRHVWLQSLPPDQVPACGPALGYLLEEWPLQEVIAMVLKGDGNCAKIDAAWLGLSLPTWTLVAFVGLALWALVVPMLAGQRLRYTL